MVIKRHAPLLAMRPYCHHAISLNSVLANQKGIIRKSSG